MPQSLDTDAVAVMLGTGLTVFVTVSLLVFLSLEKVRQRLEILVSRYVGSLDASVGRSSLLDDVGFVGKVVGWFAFESRSRLSTLVLIVGVVGLIGVGIVTGKLILAYFLLGVLIGFPFLLTQAIDFVMSRRVAMIEASLPDATTLIASSLGAGLTFSAALVTVATNMRGPLATEARIASNEIAAGASVASALQGIARRTQSEYVAMFVAAVSVHLDRGGNLVIALQELGSALTRILLAEGEVRAKTAGARRETVWASLIPFVIVPLGLLAEPEIFGQLFFTTLGQILLVLALGFWAFCVRKLYEVSHRQV